MAGYYQRVARRDNRQFWQSFLRHQRRQPFLLLIRLALDAPTNNWQARQGEFRTWLWLYPDHGVFTLSDDYLAFFALIEAGVSSWDCAIMGEPSIEGIKNVRGPAPLEFVRNLPGGSDYDPTKAEVLVIKEMPGD
jgi:hypothetical protein